MSAAVAIAMLGAAAIASFPVRKHLPIVAPLSLSALAAAAALIADAPLDSSATVLDLPFRLSALSRLGTLVLLGIIALLVLDVWLGEPAYNFFPTALGVAASVVAVLSATLPLAIYGALVIGLLLPVGSFTYQVHRNHSVDAAVRHFAFVALGGSLGLASLALAAGLPKDQPANTLVLLAIVLVIAFALKLAAIPFHTHAALLVSEAPVASLALYFGVLVPATFLAFPAILTLSGLLPAIAQVAKVEDALIGIGLLSAIGGALLATGAGDLRRLVVYGVISNLGASLVGIATFSGPGIVGAISIALVTGACATQQLLAAGALERAAGPERPSARVAPLAAGAFVVGGAGMIGIPPLVGFPGHFFVELMAFALNGTIGALLVLAGLLLLVAQLRAGMTLFGGIDTFHVEPRPVAGAVGGIIFAAMLLGGISPDTALRPIAAFAEELLKALNPL